VLLGAGPGPRNQQRVKDDLCRAYNRLITQNPALNPASAGKLKELRRVDNKSSLDSFPRNYKLPRIPRFHSFVKPEEEDRIEKEIVRNCHMLIDLSPARRVSSSFRLPENPEKDYSVDPFDRKMSLFRSRRSSYGGLDLTNKLF
jgi:hypothetical protein